MAGKSLFRDDVPEVVIKSIFRKYDSDNSGCLEKAEILAMLRDMGLDEKQAEVCFMLVDKDGNMCVSLTELLLWFRAGEGFKVIDDQNRYAYVRRVADEFIKYDRNASGVIDREEFRALLASGSKEWNQCSEEQIVIALKVWTKMAMALSPSLNFWLGRTGQMQINVENDCCDREAKTAS